MAKGKIENGQGFPDATKAGSYYWVKHGLITGDWEICQWDGTDFYGYGLQEFSLKINFPSEYQEIKKPK